MDRVKKKTARQRWVKWETRDGRVLLILLILLAFISYSSGCIRLVQKSVSNNDVSMVNEPSVIGENKSTIEPIKTVQTRTKITAAETPKGLATPDDTPAIVAEAPPVLQDQPSEISHAAKINGTSTNPRITRVPEFTKKYPLRSNATGLLVNVTKGPLTVSFTIETDYDCIKDPDSCKSSLTESVTRPYCIITVRENATGTIVDQDGYAREYSAATSNRTMTVYGQGLYHITLEGSGLDLTLAITTGASPVLNATLAAEATQAKLSPADYERIMRHRQGG